MQFDHDLQSPYANLFLRLRDLFLSFDEIHEVKNANQTSYKDTNGYAIVLMRVREEGLRLTFAQGAKLQSQYPFLRGEGKVVRYLLLQNEEEMDEKLLKEMIGESLVLTLEHEAMRILRTQLRH